jgi:hypothetical protein
MMFKRPNEGMIFRFRDSAGIEHETVEAMQDGIHCQRCRLRNPKKGF